MLSKLSRRFWTLVLVACPALIVFGVGRAGISHSTGTLLVMLEPALLALAVYAAAAFALHRRWHASLATVMMIGTGAVALHAPLHIAEPSAAAPDWLRPLRKCAVLPKAAKAPVRLVSWTVDDKAPMGEVLAEIKAKRPDLVVLVGTDDKAIGTELSEAMGGEVKFLPYGDGITAAVRGSFQYCEGTVDHWVIHMPAAVEDGAQAFLTFPHIEHVGVMPLMIVRADRPQGAADLTDWTQRQSRTSDLLASAVQVLGPSRMLLVGDFQAPATSQVLTRPLHQSGLQSIPTPPNWPQRVGGLPFLPVHALDHMWAGSSWHAQRARTMASGAQVRAPLIVDLTPIEAHAQQP